MDMTLVDLLIVYLACGAPFAVYQATGRDKQSRFRRLVEVSFVLLFWPWQAFALVRKAIVNRLSADEKHLDDIRNSIEARLFPDGSSSNIFEFRDAFYRFAGLERASHEKPSNGSFEIFKVSNHPNAQLASRILARRNLRRIQNHKVRAEAEFSNILSQNSAFDLDPELGESLARLSPSLNFDHPSKPPVSPTTHSAARV
jgi:hypothetical protein